MSNEPMSSQGGSPANVIADGLKRRGRGSATALAEALGLNPSSVSRWARGDDRPDMARWPAIEDFLDLDRGAIARSLGITDTEMSLRQELSDLAAKVDMLQAAVEQLEAHLGRGQGGDTGSNAPKRRRRKN